MYSQLSRCTTARWSDTELSLAGPTLRYFLSNLIIVFFVGWPHEGAPIIGTPWQLNHFVAITLLQQQPISKFYTTLYLSKHRLLHLLCHSF